MNKIFEAFIISVCLTLTVSAVVGVGIYINSILGWIGSVVYVMLICFTMFALAVGNMLDWWHDVQRRIY